MIYFRWYADSGSVAVECWLEDLNTTVDGLAKGTLSVILVGLKEKDGLGNVGDFGVWRNGFGKIQLQDHRI